MATDCVPCHFEWEEKHVLPYLCRHEQAWLLEEHRTLRLRGYPAAEVIEHAEREMPIFRARLPPHLLAHVENDHERFHPTLIEYARRGLNAPTTAIG